MLLLPFPLLIAELVIFILAVQEWGFLSTVGYYFLPSLLGIIIVSSMRRFAWTQLQVSMMRGELPAQTLLNSALIFISGLLFMVPSVFARLLAIVFFLPGLRHFAGRRIRKHLGKKFSQGQNNFGFTGNFGFGNGSTGFRYYDFRSSQGPMKSTGERDVTDSNPKVLDVTPLEIVHSEQKKSSTED